MNIGMPELILIAAVALLFFGPSKLPGLGKSIGQAIRGFKSAIDGKPEEDQNNQSPSKMVGESPTTTKAELGESGHPLKAEAQSVLQNETPQSATDKKHSS